MSLEWVSWVLWTASSLLGCFCSNLDTEFFVLAFSGAVFVFMCLYATGIGAEQWHENKR